ncbi:hypothetical protein P8625_11525 [Tenacibaculum tangerinum]|uniref:Uncharacterized protein n=1 Tax=Tenacibaculum tangerinum TaxID=3038772 RepID=A0ABY8KZS3_9FLAO|nr:hypothetical protein [Tenacibaculum tangerinum]WGH74709.1 hypothetical protein P8625_11525 [Tenacibaculum tangerinum]
MNNPEQMIYCEQCKNRKLDIATNIVLCSLTNQKPNFEHDCDKFIANPENKTELKKENKVPKNYSRDIIAVIIFFVALYRLIRLFF